MNPDQDIKWEQLTIENLKSVLSCSEKPYWISGGWALDLFLQRKTRKHDDLDISIRRQDQSYFQKILSSWDLQACDPPEFFNKSKTEWLLKSILVDSGENHPWVSVLRVKIEEI